jgi:hypothetical protein
MSAESFQAYKELLNSKPEGRRYYETLILSHSLLSQTYYFVNDSVDLVANDNDGLSRTYTALPFQSSNAVNSNDLSQTATYSLPDVQNILDDELDRIPIGNTENILATFGIYESDFLDSPAEWLVYEVDKVPQKKGSFSIQTGVPKLNSDETGEIYDFQTWPMLRSV